MKESQVVTNLLRKAFAEAGRLDGAQQDALARWLLDELASERRWDETFAGSQDAQGTLADEALAEHRNGHTRALDPDTL